MSNFKLIKKEYIEDIKATGYIYKHRTGARVVFMDCEDTEKVFSLAFSTLPENDMGFAHIVEHSVLCGSEKYRIKDPFNILEKGSVHSYLNALTYSDKTIYPVASISDKDFENLVRVYIDAVHRPLMYENEGIYRQEGWRSDGETVSGIVLNEMKGSFSHPVSTLVREVKRVLFEGTSYAYTSAGVPGEIEKGKYEDFLDFHRRKYHPSNAVIYFYGALDIEYYFDILEKEYLSYYEPKIFVFNKDISLKSGRDVFFRKKGKKEKYFCAAYYTGNNCEYAKNIAFTLLCDAVVNGENSPMRKALTSSSLVLSPEADNDESCFLSSLMLIAKQDKGSFEDIKEKIEEQWQNIAENGVDEYLYKAALNEYKFCILNEDFGYKPKGLFYNIRLLKGLMSGDESFESIKMQKIFKEIESIDVRELVKEYILNKGVYGQISLDESYEEEEATIVAEKNDSSFEEYCNMEDTKEALSSITVTDPKSLDADSCINLIDYDVDEGDIYVPVKSEDITYLDMFFDTSSLTEEEFPVLGLLAYMSKNYDAKRCSDIDYYLGDFTVYPYMYKTVDSYKPGFIIGAEFLSENKDFVFNIISSLINTRYEQKERFYYLIKELKQNLEESFITRGNTLALNTAMSSVDDAYAYNFATGGYSLYNYITNAKEPVKDITRLAQKLFCKNNFSYTFASGEKEKKSMISSLKAFKDSLPERIEEGIFTLPKVYEDTAYILNTNVNFNAQGFSYGEKTLSVRVASQILSSEYMWENIRIKGGAYGGDFSFIRRDCFYMYSYRDPALTQTYSVFEKAGKYLEEKNFDSTEFQRFKIGALNKTVHPIKNSSLCGVATARYYRNITEEKLRKNFEILIDTTPNDIKEIGVAMQKKKGKKCSVGMEESIKESGLFSKVYDMRKNI